MFWKRKPKPAAPARGDPEVESLRAALARRREQVAALELEYFELNRFADEIAVYLLPLQRRLDELQAQLAEARRRAARRAGAASSDAPRDRFDRSDSASARTASPPPPPAPEPPDEAEIKALYRALAKRFHPDLTTDPAEKEWRKQMMAQVNAAYAARDMSALQALAAQPDHPPVTPPKTRESLLAEMRVEIERLDGVIAGLERTLDGLAASPAVQLKLDANLARRAGQNLLGQMAADLEAAIARAEAELAALR
jgi:hypothetical protein